MLRCVCVHARCSWCNVMNCRKSSDDKCFRRDEARRTASDDVRFCLHHWYDDLDLGTLHYVIRQLVHSLWCYEPYSTITTYFSRL